MTEDDARGFHKGSPPIVGAKVELLCRHEGRAMRLPLLAQWSEQGWVFSGTKRVVPYDVVGWRRPRVGPPGRD